MDDIKTARSPQKASRPRGEPRTDAPSASASSTAGEAGEQRGAGDRWQRLQDSGRAAVAHSERDAASAECDDEMGDEALAELAAGVDWDDDDF